MWWVGGWEAELEPLEALGTWVGCWGKVILCGDWPPPPLVRGMSWPPSSGTGLLVVVGVVSGVLGGAWMGMGGLRSVGEEEEEEEVVGAPPVLVLAAPAPVMGGGVGGSIFFCGGGWVGGWVGWVWVYGMSCGITGAWNNSWCVVGQEGRFDGGGGGLAARPISLCTRAC